MNKSGGIECIAWTWGIATLAGAFVAGGLWVLGSWTFMQGAFMGVLALLTLGALLTIMMCRSDAPAVSTATAGGPAKNPAKKPAVPMATPRPAEPAPAAPAPAPVAPAAAEPSPLQPVAAAPAAPAAPTPAAEAANDPGEATRPVALDGPRGGTADDLKRIKGIGPKLEVLVNTLGFYHFDQIAAWTPAEITWVDENLQGFKGRVTRDAWVEQARLLAAGGETEFSKKVDNGSVY